MMKVFCEEHTSHFVVSSLRSLISWLGALVIDVAAVEEERHTQLDQFESGTEGDAQIKTQNTADVGNKAAQCVGGTLDKGLHS